MEYNKKNVTADSDISAALMAAMWGERRQERRERCKRTVLIPLIESTQQAAGSSGQLTAQWQLVAASVQYYFLCQLSYVSVLRPAPMSMLEKFEGVTRANNERYPVDFHLQKTEDRSRQAQRNDRCQGLGIKALNGCPGLGFTALNRCPGLGFTATSMGERPEFKFLNSPRWVDRSTGLSPHRRSKISSREYEGQ